METNNRFIEIEGIDAPILLEEGLDIDFAKKILSKCNKNDFKNGDVIIINKETMYALHKTELAGVGDGTVNPRFELSGDNTVIYPKEL